MLSCCLQRMYSAMSGRPPKKLNDGFGVACPLRKASMKEDQRNMDGELLLAVPKSFFAGKACRGNSQNCWKMSEYRYSDKWYALLNFKHHLFWDCHLIKAYTH